ncbi:MAG TPA: hypothetical protein DDW95_15025 [Alphaproteobacteria bacterium]|nr:hypothetical protein [Alphaproteobacteria bacterium]HBF99854.1 hypothetical protein [Alphaproteobacteria bacterium]HCO90466.1 hypothetical protein [Alphaproteobacteria bacterium]
MTLTEKLLNQVEEDPQSTSLLEHRQRFVQTVYRIRIVGLLLLGLSLGAPLFDRATPLADWVFLLAVVFVWPHVAYLLSRSSPNPAAAEVRNVLIDSLLGGIAMGAIAFNIIPCVVVYLVLCINSFGLNTKLFGQSVLMVICGAAGSAVLHGFQFDPHSSLYEILFSLPVLLIYPILAGYASRNAARRLRRQTDALSAEVTRRIAAETTAQRARMAAEQANHTKSEFLAGMSHEFRTPLNAIIGFADALKAGIAGPLNDKQAGYADHISKSGGLLLELVSDLLDLSKLEAGKNNLTEVAISLPALADEVLPLVQEQALAQQLTLATEFPDNLPQLCADARLVKQMLINLLSNAVKFTPDGGRITLSARCTGEDEIAMTVEDTGIGMRAEDIPRAMRKFEQLDTDRKNEGTGLGLPLVHEMITLHGGQLKLQSEPGVGTRATLYFPASRVLAA